MESIDEQQLINLAAEHNLGWEKHGEFITKWAAALLSYGTPPIKFLEGSVYSEGKAVFGGKECDVIFKSGGNYELRRELSKSQKPYVPARDPAEYEEEFDIRLDFDKCFLCQNVVQGFDAMNNPDLENVIDGCDDYFIMPNKYPSFAGHSLWVPVSHDDPSGRVKPIPLPEEKTDMYIPEKGKTRGAILQPCEFNALMDATARNHLVASKNHVLDGMSIPDHDHFHLTPEDNLYFFFVEKFLSDQTDNYGKGIFRVKDTPFDTLVITTDVKENYVIRACSVLENMERDNQGFTLQYLNGAIFISPRKNIDNNKRINRIGAGAQLHLIDLQTKEFYGLIEKHIPMRGEYNWKKYLE